MAKVAVVHAVQPRARKTLKIKHKAVKTRLLSSVAGTLSRNLHIKYLNQGERENLRRIAFFFRVEA